MYDIGSPNPKRVAKAKERGNLKPGDGIKYCGKGLVQLTGAFNYAKYGKIVGVDLLNNPDVALKPDVSIAVLAAYFHDHGCDVHSNYGNWRKGRFLVNGGYNHFDLFQNYVYNLLDKMG